MSFFKKLISSLYKNKDFAKSSLSGVVLFICLTLLTLISYPIIVQKLGIEVYGVWVTISIVVSLSQLGDMGFNDGVIMKISESILSENKTKKVQIISSFFVFILLSSIAIAFILLLFKNVIIDFLEISIKENLNVVNLFFWVITMIPLILVSNYLKAVLQGIGKYTYANYSFIFLRLFQVVLSIVLLYLDYNIWSLVIANYCFFTLCNLIYFYFLIKFKASIRISYFDYKVLKDVLSFGFKVFISRVVQKFFIDELIKIFIAKHYGFKAVGSFDISFKIIRLIRSLFDHAMKPTINEVTKLVKQTPKLALGFVTNLQKKIILPIIPFVILLIIFADFIFKIWLGSAFNEEIIIFFRILMCSYIINFFAIPTYNGLLGGGFSKEIIVSTFISVIIILSGVLILIFFKEKNNIHPVLLYGIMIIINSSYLIYIFNKKNNIEIK